MHGKKIEKQLDKEQEAGTKGLHSSENPNNNSNGPNLAKENHFV
jgi:hypothetical protein